MSFRARLSRLEAHPAARYGFQGGALTDPSGALGFLAPCARIPPGWRRGFAPVDPDAWLEAACLAQGQLWRRTAQAGRAAMNGGVPARAGGNGSGRWGE